MRTAAQREALPARRFSNSLDLTHEFEAGKPRRYRAQVGYYSDGRPGEVFLNHEKHNTELDSMAQDAAIAISIALQYGVPPEVLRGAMARDHQGYPTSPFGMLLDEVCE